jgi:hypothetical protein
MNEHKGKASRLANRTPNAVMNRFELTMGESHSGKHGFFLFSREMLERM